MRPRFVSKKEVLATVNWTAQTKLLINKYQSAKLLGISHKSITNTWILEGDIVAIEIQNFKIEYLPLSDYEQIFIKNRQERLEEIRIDNKENKILAVNIHKQSFYQLTPTDNAIHCECIDYQNQINAFGKGTCKHGYALLSHYNLSSLSDYILAKEEEKDYYERQEYLHLAYSHY